MRHTWDFEVAEVVVYFGSDFFDSLVIVEAAVREDEFVGEAVWPVSVQAIVRQGATLILTRATR